MGISRFPYPASQQKKQLRKSWVTKTTAGTGTVVNWGNIQGTLSAQTDLQNALDLKLDAADYTAADVLTKLLTVDGVGSGLDADLLDGQSSAYYLSRSNHTGTQLASTISDFNTAADARITAAIGVTVQAFDSDLSTLAANITTFGHSLVDDANAAAARTTLGLGTSATVDTGTSGTKVPLLDGNNVWDGTATFNAGVTLGDASGDAIVVNGTASFVPRAQFFAGATMRSGNSLQLNNAANTLGASFTFDGTNVTLSAPLSGTTVTQAAGDNSTKFASTAYVRTVSTGDIWRTLLNSSGSHTAAKVAGTYGMGHGDPLAVTGTGTLYPLNIIRIDSADYPTRDGLSPKFRIKTVINCNDVAPTGNYTVGLHPVTRPGTSGGAGLAIYTIGAAATGSTATSTTPAADSQNVITSADFALPADGYYVIAVVTTATVAASAHMHFSSVLQSRNA